MSIFCQPAIKWLVSLARSARSYYLIRSFFTATSERRIREFCNHGKGRPITQLPAALSSRSWRNSTYEVAAAGGLEFDAVIACAGGAGDRLVSPISNARSKRALYLSWRRPGVF